MEIKTLNHCHKENNDEYFSIINTLFIYDVGRQSIYLGGQFNWKNSKSMIVWQFTLEFRCWFANKLLFTRAIFYRLSQHAKQQILIYFMMITGSSLEQDDLGQLTTYNNNTTLNKYINKFTKELRHYWSTIRVGYILPLVSSKHVGGSIYIASMEFTQNPGWTWGFAFMFILKCFWW